MSAPYLTILNQFLTRQGYYIGLDELYVEFFSHPDFPSFQSITNTLDHFSIHSLAASIPKEQFGQLDQAVLVHLSVKGKNQLAIAEKEGENGIRIWQGEGEGKTVVIKKDEFENLWDGNLIAIEKNNQKKSYSIDRIALLVVLLSFLAVYQEINGQGNIRTIVFQGLTGLGLYLSYLVIQTTIRFNHHGSRFCSFSKSTDCERVINSDSSRILGLFSLSDLSLIYFLTLNFSLLIGVSTSILVWVSALSLPVVIYSIYQQAIILKKWCPLCLGIGLVICAQFLILISDFEFVFTYNSFYSIGALLIIGSLVFIAWQWLKPFLTVKKDAIEQAKELKTFKRNYHLFVPYFHSLPILDTSITVPDIHLSGETNAPIKILAITNPLCKHCQEVHHMLEHLGQKYPEDLRIDLRFYTPQADLNDPRILVSCGMLKAYKEDKESFHQRINHWYERGDVRSFLETVGLERPEDEYLQILGKHTKWCTANGIGVTPVLLLNNRVFPTFYQTTDLAQMVGALMEDMKSERVENFQSG